MAVVVPGITDRIPTDNERLVSRTYLPYSGVKVGRIPTDIVYPSGPDPFTGVRPPFPTITQDEGWTFHIQAGPNQTWVDFTFMVNSGTWKDGEQTPNRIGYVATPASGSLYLKDSYGFFSPAAPSPTTQPWHGAAVEIWSGNAREVGNLLFKGWNKGIQWQSGTNEPSFVVMPLYGPLARLEAYGEGFAARLDGQRLISDVVDIILDNMEWEGRRVIYQSDVLVRTSRLNRKGVLSKGLRRRTTPMGAFRTLAVLEGSRIYDTNGAIVCESFSQPRGLNPPVEGNANYHRLTNPHRIKQLESDRLVVNVVEQETDNWVSRGDRPLEFVGYDLPFPFQIPPDSRDYEFDLYISPDLLEEGQFIESINRPVRNIDYTYSLGSFDGEPVEPQFRIFTEGVTVIVSNPTNTVQELVLIRIVGEIFKSPLGVRIGERNARSIELYGPKNVVYDGSMVVDQELMRAKARYWINEWGGLDSDGNPLPPIPLEVTDKDPQNNYQISDLVRLDWVVVENGQEIVHFINYPFWIDAREFQFNADDGDREIKLTLSDAYRKALQVSEEVPGTPDTPDGPGLPPRRVIERLVSRTSLGTAGTTILETLVSRTVLLAREERVSRTSIEPTALGQLVSRTYIENRVARVMIPPPPAEERVSRTYFENRVSRTPMPVERRVSRTRIELLVSRTPFEVRVSRTYFERLVSRTSFDRLVSRTHLPVRVSRTYFERLVSRTNFEHRVSRTMFPPPPTTVNAGNFSINTSAYATSYNIAMTDIGANNEVSGVNEELVYRYRSIAPNSSDWTRGTFYWRDSRGQQRSGQNISLRAVLSSRGWGSDHATGEATGSISLSNLGIGRRVFGVTRRVQTSRGPRQRFFEEFRANSHYGQNTYNLEIQLGYINTSIQGAEVRWGQTTTLAITIPAYPPPYGYRIQPPPA